MFQCARETRKRHQLQTIRPRQLRLQERNQGHESFQRAHLSHDVLRSKVLKAKNLESGFFTLPAKMSFTFLTQCVLNKPPDTACKLWDSMQTRLGMQQISQEACPSDARAPHFFIYLLSVKLETPP